jgi:hypothetical protein
LATVGLGNVHAEGQIARALVIIQMVFTVVVLTRAAQALLASRVARRSAGEDKAAPPLTHQFPHSQAPRSPKPRKPPRGAAGMSTSGR